MQDELRRALGADEGKVYRARLDEALDGMLNGRVGVDDVRVDDVRVVLTELMEGNSNVVVAVHLNANNGRVQVNRIASLYGKDNPRALLNQPLLYWDNKKAGKWLTASRLQLPAAVPSSSRTKGKVLTPRDFYKWKVEKNLSFTTFGVRDWYVADMKREMERSRSDAVREYWGHVVDRVEAEGRALDGMLNGRVGVDVVRVRVAEARSIMKVAIGTLPEGEMAGVKQDVYFPYFLFSPLLQKERALVFNKGSFTIENNKNN